MKSLPVKIIGNKKGNIGEGIAESFLMKRGFNIVHRNYRKNYGEIDLIAEKSGITHFIEVKSVTREINDINNANSISRVTADNAPEENVHPKKLRKIGRVISAYIPKLKGGWQFSVVAVFFDEKTKKALVRFTKNLPIEL